MHAGDRLQVVVSVDSIRSAAGNDMVSIKAEVSTDEGERVVTAYGLVIERAAAGDAA